ncbi:hypothetical protein AMS68_006155 [Peltaster fructicola]|uniref:Lysophospholipase n=1 Tax=Peltaster fructicola TaxID=286661 RepID=A0A6H0Y1B6_9PEZI|nr:hypothetical protein AMS68_006155 [Peltaster fructicola]
MFSRLYNARKFSLKPSTSTFLVASAICSAGYAFQHRKSLRADSDAVTEERWRGRPTVVSHDVSLKERTRLDTSSHNPSPPRQTRNHKPPVTETSTWQTASESVSAAAQGSLKALDFGKLRDTITDFVVPGWAKMLPGMIKKFQDELSMAPWSLGWEIWEEAHDPEINPEIIWDAKVRLSTDLCSEELAFLKKRRQQTAKALARYLDLEETDINPLDVPTIAICGSGGGLRALVAGTSSFLSAREAGLFDCTTYTAGVSGSCWLQTLYFSSIGQTSFERMLNHFKARLDKHIAYPPAALQLLTQAPTNKFLLSGVVEKLKGVPDAEFGLVDVYGLLLAARLLVPKGELKVSDWDLKISNQRYFVDDGNQPLPIYTAVRHEIPEAEEKQTEKATVRKSEQNNWFQWFEWTPYEFFCEELGAGIPTWAVGRKFMAGSSVLRENGLSLPEIKAPLMMGIWGSAFCATLSHYYHEVSPVLKTAGWSGLDSLLAGRDEELLQLVHPLDPASIPNYVLGLRNQLPGSCPKSIHTATHLRLMDAGMSNNLPIYPLLRPGRDVDVIVAFDVSADASEANWIKVVEGYAKQRSIKGWPMGAGWPPRSNSVAKTKEQLDQAEAATQGSDSMPETPADDLGHCTVWVGSAVERSKNQDSDGYTARRLEPHDEDWHLTKDDAGIALVYFPFLPNSKVIGVDPTTSDYMSTWNFVYTADEIDKVVALARANFDAGREQTKRVVRAVYERREMPDWQPKRRKRASKKTKTEKRYQGTNTHNFIIQACLDLMFVYDRGLSGHCNVLSAVIEMTPSRSFKLLVPDQYFPCHLSSRSTLRPWRHESGTMYTSRAAFAAGRMGNQPSRLRTVRVARRHIQTKTVTDGDVQRLAAQPLHPLTLADLCKQGRPPLSASALLNSANFTLSILPARLAHRVQSLRSLPYIVVANPHVSKIHDNYVHSLSTLLPYAEKKIESLEEEIKFTEVMADLVHTHANTIAILARGFLEARKYISPEEITRFLDEHLRARIGTRLIAEQHIAMHLSSKPHLDLQKSGREQYKHEEESTYIGVIDTALRPSTIIRNCEATVGEICELNYGVRPSINLNGDTHATIANIPMHLNYIMTELLKNSFRATIEAGMEKEPVEITIAPVGSSDVTEMEFEDQSKEHVPGAVSNIRQGSVDAASDAPKPEKSFNSNIKVLASNTPGITIRIRDRGGGISPENYARLWEYGFTTFNEDEINEKVSGGSTALDAISNGPAGGSSLAGLGYGLPLARAYAEYFDGGIRVQSLYGHGCDVYLTLKGVGKLQ